MDRQLQLRLDDQMDDDQPVTLAAAVQAQLVLLMADAITAVLQPEGDGDE